jgi:hypothetical protein
MPTDIVRRFYAALPPVRQWIDEYLERHSAEAKTVQSLGIAGLSTYYPEDLLARAKTVTVQWVEFPPLHLFGIPEFGGLQQMTFDGITFKDTYFVRRDHESPAVHFHELVHVVQWGRLGVENFLLAYGVGLLQNRYERTPLEHMAYRLQANFERGLAIPHLIQSIEEESDAIWQRAVPFLQ